MSLFDRFFAPRNPPTGPRMSGGNGTAGIVSALVALPPIDDEDQELINLSGSFDPTVYSPSTHQAVVEYVGDGESYGPAVQLSMGYDLTTSGGRINLHYANLGSVPLAAAQALVTFIPRGGTPVAP